MSPGGSVSGAFGLTPPLVVVDAFVAEDVADELAAVCEPAAAVDVELLDEPHPAIAAATPTARRAGTVRIRPP
jgi:RNA 3'-terminal phosphate cyclase